MILVTGATGQLGAAVVDRLLERGGQQVAALVRDEHKAAGLADRGVDLRLGDYDDTDALARAMVGIDRVLLVAGNQPGARVQQHQNVIDAAHEAGVSLFGFASRSLRDIGASENTLMGDYFETEERIRRSGLPHLLFRNALYLDTVPIYVGGVRGLQRGIRLPAGEGRVAYALRREMGEALANALIDHTGPDHTYVVAAPRAYGFDDVAVALSEITGTPVAYTQVTDDEYVADALASGLAESVARRILGFYADIRDDQLSETSDDLETLLGRAPASLPAGLAEVFAL